MLSAYFFNDKDNSRVNPSFLFRTVFLLGKEPSDSVISSSFCPEQIKEFIKSFIKLVCFCFANSRYNKGNAKSSHSPGFQLPGVSASLIETLYDFVTSLF